MMKQNAYLGFLAIRKATKESNKGATSGSRVEFIGPDEQAPFILHRPHPGSILKSYVVKGIIEHIEKNDLIGKYKQSKIK